MRNRVLVVDDEELLRILLEEFLKQQGFEVITAEDGLEGVKQFQIHHHHLFMVVLDSNMPQLNGEQMLDEINRQSPKVPIIFATGFIKYEDAERVRKKGVKVIMRKPYNLEELKSHIDLLRVEER